MKKSDLPPKRPRPAKVAEKDGGPALIRETPATTRVKASDPAAAKVRKAVKTAPRAAAPSAPRNLTAPRTAAPPESRSPDRESGIRSRRPAEPIRREARRTDPVAESRRQEQTLEGLGTLFKTKREIQGLTRRDVVVKIKIPLDQLESIEDGRLSSLPPVFAKGFLRVYANELGLDAEAILEDYRRMTGGFKNEPASREPLAPRYVETSVGPGRWRPDPRLVVGAILLVAAVLVAIWLWPGIKGFIPFVGEDSAEIINGSSVLSSASARLNGEAPATGPAAREAAPEALAAATGSLEATPATGPPAEAAAEPELDGGILTLSSHKDNVWVQVVVDGRPAQHLTLKTGQKATWEAEKYITVTSGLANALSVIWNGQDLGLLGDNPIVETRFPKG